MDNSLAQIIVSLIGATATVIVTVIKTNRLRKQANKHNCRSNIMQLIFEDHVRVSEGGLPENRQLIHVEFDEYRQNGGNSYIIEKVQEYEDWFKKISEERSGGMPKTTKTKKPRKTCK